MAVALAIDRRAGLRAGEAIKLTNLGVISIDLGRLEAAAGYLGQARALRKETGTRIGTAMTLARLGHAYHALGRLGER